MDDYAFFNRFPILVRIFGIFHTGSLYTWDDASRAPGAVTVVFDRVLEFAAKVKDLICGGCADFRVRKFLNNFIKGWWF